MECTIFELADLAHYVGPVENYSVWGRMSVSDSAIEVSVWKGMNTLIRGEKNLQQFRDFVQTCTHFGYGIQSPQ